MKAIRFVVLALLWSLAGLGMAAESPKAAAAAGNETGIPTKAVGSAFRTNTLSARATANIERELDVAFKAIEQGKPDVAASLFTKVLERDPANRRGRFGLSTALIQSDKYKEALAILEAMLKETPNDYVLKNNTAWVYATARDLSMRNGRRAVQLAQEALLINPLDCHVWSTLAEAYFISGRYDKALRNAEQALRVGRETNADAKLLDQYQLQVDRCRKAAESMSILE